jgi:glycerol uptake facilitator-like aquaporin
MANIFNRKEISREIVSLCFWRDVTVEVFATFILMSVQCALPLSWAGGEAGMEIGSIVQIGLGMGCVVGATAWALGDYGGSHINPAVTVAMHAKAKITITRGAMFFCF